MDEIQRGEIWWADFPEPRRSEPRLVPIGRRYRRPVLVVQADSFNRSRIQTIIVAAITSNTELADAPGNVLLPESWMGEWGKGQTSLARLSTQKPRSANSASALKCKVV
jgi:mRNA-degrading endonuclease toxin of MazEF toxin-antitoxin module